MTTEVLNKKSITINKPLSTEEQKRLKQELCRCVHADSLPKENICKKEKRLMSFLRAYVFIMW